METAPSKAVVVRAEGLSLDPNTDVKSGLGNVPIIPVLVGNGRRSPGFVHSQSGQLVSCKFSKSSYLKRKQGRELLWKSPELVSGLYVCMHTSTAHQHVPTPHSVEAPHAGLWSLHAHTFIHLTPACPHPCSVKVPHVGLWPLRAHTHSYTPHKHVPPPAAVYKSKAKVLNSVFRRVWQAEQVKLIILGSF